MQTTPGMFMWNELWVHDVEKAKQFYETVVGWSVDAMPMPGAPEGSFYYIFKAGDQQVGGMMKIMPEMEGMSPMWGGYIHVEDVDAAAAKVTEAGGQITVPPQDIPGVGRFCALVDSNGAAVSLMSPASEEAPQE